MNRDFTKNPLEGEPFQWLFRTPDAQAIRKHWSKEAVVTGSWQGKEAREVPAGQLLPGELSAALCEVGCYTVRSAQRVYRVNQDYTETPACAEELEAYKSQWETDWVMSDGWLGDLRLVHEISARHHDGPEREFILVDGARNAHRCYWMESINAIYAAKENASVPDEYASLFVNKFWMGDSHSADYWRKLDPTERIWEISLGDCSDDDAQFYIVREPVVRFLIPEIQTEGGCDVEN